ncbi:MAG: GNAT family N-acetyltransferase [Pseudomonadota bacterium]
MPDAIPVQLAQDSPHIPALLTLIKQSFAFMEGRIDPPSSMHRLTLDKIRAQCSSGEVWAIGQPPFACIFLSEKGNRLYIGKIAVAPEHRGHGHARRLVELAEKRAQERGLNDLELETRIELTENHETFRRLGFEKVREGHHDGFKRPTYIVMRKPV